MRNSYFEWLIGPFPQTDVIAHHHRGGPPTSIEGDWRPGFTKAGDERARRMSVACTVKRGFADLNWGLDIPRRKDYSLVKKYYNYPSKVIPLPLLSYLTLVSARMIHLRVTPS